MRRETITVVRDAAGWPTALEVPAFLLRALRGPSRRAQRKCSGARAVIGSGAGADLVLEDATVSALHCEVLADERGFRVRDLGSRNGVLLGDRPVIEAWLRDGDELTVGKSVVSFTLLDAASSEPLPARTSLEGLVGSSVAMRRLYDTLERVAATDLTTLIQGETGTGKELAAEAIVALGHRRDRPFVVVDCGALTPSLAASELFGHEQGAFTDAVRSVPGAFERATTGTLFLDEVGELPPEAQAKLLGVLERQQVQRLGAAEPIAVDVRVIAATRRELEREVNRGAFRSDLYYRLAVARLRMPALHERPEDIPELVAHFLDASGARVALAPAVLQRLYDADYPGNVRELRNAVERALVGVEAPAPPGPSEPSVAVKLSVPYHLQKRQVVAAFDRAYLIALLSACQGNVAAAARRAGLSRVHLYELMRRSGVPAK